MAVTADGAGTAAVETGMALPVQGMQKTGPQQEKWFLDRHLAAPVESLQSHCIHTQLHWSSGPPICFLS